MDIKLLIALLPVIFMIHEFEEIIMFRPWLDKNRNELKRRFPKFEDFLASRSYFDYSTSAFAIVILQEFLLLVVVTYLSLYFNHFQWWFAAFMTYFIHLFVHVGQWIVYRKYVPVIITSILTLPYCFYTLGIFTRTIKMTNEQMLSWVVIGLILTLMSFISAFFFASKFEKWKNGTYDTNKETPTC